MKSFLVFISSFVIIISSSCEREELDNEVKLDKDGAIVSQPIEWSEPLSDRELIATGIRSSVVWQKNVLFSGLKNNDQVFYMKDSENGETIWQWSNFLTDFEDWDITSHYLYGSYLIVPNGPRGYCIDLSNGETIWRSTSSSDIGSLIRGLGRKYFRVGNYMKNDDGYYEGVVLMGDILNSESPHVIATPPYQKMQADILGSVGLLTGIAPFVNSDTLLLITYADPVSDKEYDNYLGLYNISKKNWEYSNKNITSNTLFAAGSLTIYGEKVFLQSSKKLFCYEVATGNKLWERSFSEGFSDMIVVDGKLIANNEDRHLYAFDPDTGRQLWKEQSSGTSSPLAYLNGVVYFTGGGDGLLHAVDTETGKHLWRIRSPDLEHNSGAWFKRHVAVVPPAKDGEKGKVLTSSYLSAICYEAAR